jgi:hypothetical protein
VVITELTRHDQLHGCDLRRTQLCVSVCRHCSRVVLTAILDIRRNAACFNCRNPRVRNGPVADMYSPAPRLPISPRFAAGPSSSPAFGMPAAFNGGSRQPPVARATFPPPARQPPAPTYSVLTPSGRTFAQGGKVQNISSDPHNVIFLFWPANEPPPQQSQLRPPLVNHSNVRFSHVALLVPELTRYLQLPPIMNTGAKGPIEVRSRWLRFRAHRLTLAQHQPGDWVCGVCQYLNWRRRKICQACFPCTFPSCACKVVWLTRVF